MGNPELTGKGFIPAFGVPKGIQPFIDLYQHVVMNMGPAEKSDAAQLLGWIMKLTPPAGLKPYVMKVTGSLIRVIGGKHFEDVMTPLLENLKLLLRKMGIALKPFAPQLQKVFMKSLKHRSEKVRTRACDALGLLMGTVQRRPETAVTALANELKGTPEDNPGVQYSIIQAHIAVLKIVLTALNPDCIKTATNAVLPFLEHDEERVRCIAGECVGLLASAMDDETFEDEIFERCLDVSGTWRRVHGRAVLFASVLKHAFTKIDDLEECLNCMEDYAARITQVSCPL